LRFRYEFDHSRNAAGVRLRPGAARIFASRPVQIARLIANRLGLRRSNRKGCDLGRFAGARLQH
jgi:hypothetical protein